MHAVNLQLAMDHPGSAKCVAICLQIEHILQWSVACCVKVLHVLLQSFGMVSMICMWLN